MTYPVKLFKVTSLPPTSQIEPNSLYLISNPVVSDYLEIGVSNETGTSIVKIPNRGDIEAIVKNQTSSTNVNESIKAYIRSRGQQLVTNGTGLLLNNINFDGFVFDASDSYYASGSFTTTRFNYVTNVNEIMPVNIEDTYRLTHYIKTDPTVGAVSHAHAMCFDIDKKQILSQHIMWNGTMGELLTDFKEGDTVVNVSTTQGWKNAGNTAIVFWNYRNSLGYLYKPQTYSRNVIIDAWAPGMATGTTVTLKKPYDGSFGTVPAGTPVSSGNVGGSMSYFTNLFNTVTTDQWMKVTGTIGGVDTEGKANQFKFRPGTAYIQIGWSLNRNIDGGKSWISNVSFGLNYAMGV